MRSPFYTLLPPRARSSSSSIGSGVSRRRNAREVGGMENSDRCKRQVQFLDVGSLRGRVPPTDARSPSHALFAGSPFTNYFSKKTSGKGSTQERRSLVGGREFPHWEKGKKRNLNAACVFPSFSVWLCSAGRLDDCCRRETRTTLLLKSLSLAGASRQPTPTSRSSAAPHPSSFLPFPRRAGPALFPRRVTTKTRTKNGDAAGNAESTPALR